jgi:hypothetical protein
MRTFSFEALARLLTRRLTAGQAFDLRFDGARRKRCGIFGNVCRGNCNSSGACGEQATRSR